MDVNAAVQYMWERVPLGKYYRVGRPMTAVKPGIARC